MRLATAFSLVVVTGLAAVPDTALAAPAIRLAAPAKLQAADVPGSVDYLTKKYGISVDEAIRRLELQQTAGALQEVLARDYADTYAGAWIDQENGGVLAVASTAAGALAPALSAIPDRDHIRVVAARHSLKELEAKAADVSARLGLKPAQAPVINARENRVELYHEAAAAARGSADRLAAAADPDVAVVDSPPMTNAACEITWCPTPMRGGVRLEFFDSKKRQLYKRCTNGFNVKDTNGWEYTLTAGHCLEGEEYFSKHTNAFVGHWDADTYFAGYPIDAALMPYVTIGSYEYVKYWAQKPRNMVISRNTTQFRITGWWQYKDILNGWVACATGQTSNNTACGEVVKKDGGIWMNICRKLGDSGGPLFSENDHKAYGILSQINNADTGICNEDSLSTYSPVSKILDSFSYGGLTYSLHTTD
ncbi:S1 family peptidase [Nonomuraea angiospora]|uniref:Streptogrisin C n=1 Tax=Nonomuraea angiospora TaxID=46172 RepID=A0ABR9LYI1_9ACTN|nr:S1 family peptidase [Nonomuraea angiospora]MBE1585405.1 streptogrisin C [Nonomuraea angiospora]